MTFQHVSRRMLLVALVLMPVFVALPALADALDDLRASGAVGERFDGFLELRDASNSAAKAKIEQLNEQRRKIYEKRAKADGATVAQVGQIYAKQILAKAPKGTWFHMQDGKWVQK
ncbi:MAG: DUF1318 domain-containing protein [Rhodospirillales bacterium]|nr:DUF1318 domain-containing protein [Rhodospirillales bacterium]